MFWMEGPSKGREEALVTGDTGQGNSPHPIFVMLPFPNLCIHLLLQAGDCNDQWAETGYWDIQRESCMYVL